MKENMSPQNIMIIKTNLLGDVLNFVPVYNGLREHFPKARFCWVVTESGCAVVEEFTDADEIIIFQNKEFYNYLNVFNVAKKLKKFKPDMVVSSYQEECFLVSLLAKLSGARLRLGYNFRRRFNFFNEIIDSTPGRRRADINLDLLDHFEISGRDSYFYFRKDLKALQEDFINRFCKENRINGNFAVLHLLSQKPTRSWPVAHFMRLPSLVRDELGLVPVAVGDDPIMKETIKKYPDLDVIFAEDISITELYALIKNAALFIGIDSFPLQLAEFTETPVVSIFGSTDHLAANIGNNSILLRSELECSPCWPKQNCRFGFKCQYDITPWMVVDAAEKILNHKSVIHQD